MINSRNIWTIIIGVFVLMIAIPMSYAGPMDERTGHFIFSLPQGFSSESDGWRLYIVSVGQFEADGWNFSDYKGKFIKEYIDMKKECGGNDKFYREVREFNAEEKGHMTCILNGVDNDTHCNMTASRKTACASLIPYKIEEDYYSNTEYLTFGSYYKSHLYDIGKADFYHHFEPLECRILANNTCDMYALARENIRNPFMVVLDKTSSDDKVYFSEVIDIKSFDRMYDGSLPVCDQPPCSGEIVVNQEITKISLGDDHRLDISFREYAKDVPVIVGSDGKKSSDKSIVFLVAAIVLLLIVLSLAQVLRKRRKRSR